MTPCWSLGATNYPVCHYMQFEWLSEIIFIEIRFLVICSLFFLSLIPSQSHLKLETVPACPAKNSAKGREAFIWLRNLNSTVSCLEGTLSMHKAKFHLLCFVLYFWINCVGYKQFGIFYVSRILQSFKQVLSKAEQILKEAVVIHWWQMSLVHLGHSLILGNWMELSKIQPSTHLLSLPTSTVFEKWSCVVTAAVLPTVFLFWKVTLRPQDGNIEQITHLHVLHLLYIKVKETHIGNYNILYAYAFNYFLSLSTQKKY